MRGNPDDLPPDTSPRASGPERADIAEVTAFGTDMTADD